MGCSRPGGVPSNEDPMRLCSTYVNGARYPVAIDRYGLTGSSNNVVTNPSTTTTVQQPGITIPTLTQQPGPSSPTLTQPPRPSYPTLTQQPGPSSPTYTQQPGPGSMPVQGGTSIYGPRPTTYPNTSPVAPTYNGAEKLPSIQPVEASVNNARATEVATVEQIRLSASTTGRSISDSFERLKLESQNALNAANPTGASSVMGRITATIDNGRHSVNNALSNAQHNPEGAMADARNAAAITLAEVERTLKENGVPEQVATQIMEKARAEVNGAIDQGVAQQQAAIANNAQAKAQVKTTAELKIEEITVAANQQVSASFDNFNNQVKATIPNNPARQREIEDILNRAKNDIAANMVTAKNNPAAAAQPSRTTAHAALNEITRILQQENVPQEVINQLVEPTRTDVINTINEAEYKIGNSVYLAGTVGVRV